MDAITLYKVLSKGMMKSRFRCITAGGGMGPVASGEPWLNAVLSGRAIVLGGGLIDVYCIIKAN